MKISVCVELGGNKGPDKKSAKEVMELAYSLMENNIRKAIKTIDDKLELEAGEVSEKSFTLWFSNEPAPRF